MTLPVATLNLFIKDLETCKSNHDEMEIRGYKRVFQRPHPTPIVPKNRDRLCYTILRRIIQGKTLIKHPITIEYLCAITYELEGKSTKELRLIHKREIGY